MADRDLVQSWIIYAISVCIHVFLCYTYVHAYTHTYTHFIFFRYIIFKLHFSFGSRQDFLFYSKRKQNCMNKIFLSICLSKPKLKQFYLSNRICSQKSIIILSLCSRNESETLFSSVQTNDLMLLIWNQ